jgi:hypothetical protein
MTNLENFLNKEIKISEKDLANGAFKCQNDECDEIVLNASFDVNTNKLTWVCSNGHESKGSM